MAVKSKEELFAMIKDKIGEDNSDEAISFIEDVVDTFNDMESRTNSSEDWEQKYANLDNSWREKYKARFFGKVDEEEEEEEPTEPNKKLNFEDLFEESEEK